MERRIGLATLLLSLCLISLANTISAQKTDRTLEIEAQGQEVVDAVLMKLKSSGIFPADYEMMDRIAWTESRFGTYPGTFRDGYHGGIWQVDKIGFEDTQNIRSHPSLLEKFRKVKQEFGIDWSYVEYEELRKPLYSCLAARLLLSNKPGRIPESLREQARYYKHYYNSNDPNAKGSAEKYIEDSENLTKKRCKNSAGKMDIALVLDGSGSIGEPNFRLAKSTVAEMASRFFRNGVRVGFIVYSEYAETIFSLTDTFSSADEMKRRILSADYPSSSTKTNLGITEAIHMLGSDSDSGLPRIITVYTDGNSDSYSDTKWAADSAKQRGITLYAVGIGSGINHDELEMISGGGISKFSKVLETQSFQTFSETPCMVTTALSSIPQQPAVNTTVSDTLQENETRNYAFQIPVQGITITMEDLVGNTEAYYSMEYESPNAAFHDGVIDGPTYIPPSSITFVGDEKDAPSRRRRSVATTGNITDNGKVNKIKDDRLFITVYGMEGTSNYTLTSVEGNAVQDNIAALAIIISLIVLISCIALIGVIFYCKKYGLYAQVN